jgi:hypothetical protein
VWSLRRRRFSYYSVSLLAIGGAVRALLEAFSRKSAADGSYPPVPYDLWGSSLAILAYVLVLVAVVCLVLRFKHVSLPVLAGAFPNVTVEAVGFEDHKDSDGTVTHAFDIRFTDNEEFTPVKIDCRYFVSVDTRDEARATCIPHGQKPDWAKWYPSEMPFDVGDGTTRQMSLFFRIPPDTAARVVDPLVSRLEIADTSSKRVVSIEMLPSWQAPHFLRNLQPTTMPADWAG